MSSLISKKAGIFVLVLVTLFAFSQFVQAAELPFDRPASGSEILCYLDNTEEIDGISIHPPTPIFGTGSDCEDSSTTPPPPPPSPSPSPTPSPEPSPTPPPSPQCSNGSDDDSDGKIDSADPGCHTDFDATNPNSYDPNGDNEAAVPPQCSNGSDDDQDGLTDMADLGCSDASDNDETNSTGGGGGHEGSGGGGGGSHIQSTSTGIVLGFSTTTESCERYLTEFIREGHDNDVDQVKRLQRFLRDFEGENVVENGTYDKDTLAAVHAFQTKYAADILTPWGIQESTGYVYLTTRKKVNEIFCRYTKVFYLTVDELNKIEAARATQSSGGAVLPSSNTQKAQASGAGGKLGSTTATGTPAVGAVFDFLRGMFGKLKGLGH